MNLEKISFGYMLLSILENFFLLLFARYVFCNFFCNLHFLREFCVYLSVLSHSEEGLRKEKFKFAFVYILINNKIELLNNHIGHARKTGHDKANANSVALLQIENHNRHLYWPWRQLGGFFPYDYIGQLYQLRGFDFS